MELIVPIILAGLAAAGLVELVARWWIRRRAEYFVLPPGLRLHLRVDRETFPELEPEVRFEVNSDGERGREAPRQSPGLYRVLVCGGSQPEGYLLDQDTTWPGALQCLLDTTAAKQALGADRVHVGCIARSGVGSEALDLILSRTLPRYPKLQLIIILVGATDVLRWLEDGAPGLAPPVRAADAFRCHPEGPFSWKPSGLATGELLRRVRRSVFRPIVRHDRAGRWIHNARAMRARAKEIVGTMPNPTAMLDHFQFHFRRVLDQAQAHADRVLVIRQPWFDKTFNADEAAHMWHGGAGQAWRQELSTYYSFEVVSRLMAAVDSRAERVARAHGVEQLDLMRWLPASLDTYYDGFHLTPLGARLTAAAVAASVLEMPLPDLGETQAAALADAADLPAPAVSRAS